MLRISKLTIYGKSERFLISMTSLRNAASPAIVHPLLSLQTHPVEAVDHSLINNRLLSGKKPYPHDPIKRSLLLSRPVIALIPYNKIREQSRLLLLSLEVLSLTVDEETAK